MCFFFFMWKQSAPLLQNCFHRKQCCFSHTVWPGTAKEFLKGYLQRWLLFDELKKNNLQYLSSPILTLEFQVSSPCFSTTEDLWRHPEKLLWGYFSTAQLTHVLTQIKISGSCHTQRRNLWPGQGGLPVVGCRGQNLGLDLTCFALWLQTGKLYKNHLNSCGSPAHLL